jgi:hypothetical protein
MVRSMKDYVADLAQKRYSDTTDRVHRLTAMSRKVVRKAVIH